MKGSSWSRLARRRDEILDSRLLELTLTIFRLKVCWQGIILLACLTSMGGALSDSSIEAARMAYAQGRFAEAAELAESIKTSEGLALAAKSLAIFGYHVAEDDSKLVLFDRAALLAEEATRLDADNPDAWVQLAHAMGRYAQTIGMLEAAGTGYPKRVREALEKALRLNPESADAHLSLATWHAEAVNTGGFMARMLYGASKKDALAHYRKAIRLAPEEKVIYAQYAFGLLLLNETANRDHARELLERALRMPSKDAHDRLFHQMAAERLAALDNEKPKAGTVNPER